MAEWGFGFSFDMELEKPLDFFDVKYKNGEKVRYDKRPHGEWIEHRKHNSTGYFFSEYECSVCHDEVWQKTEWQFCPRCGSDNRKSGEAE